MNISKLTDYQLYELIQNSKLDKDLRNLANSEFNNRKLSIDKIQEIVQRHDTQFKPEKDEPLKTEYKFLIILFPFVIPIQSLFATQWLAKGQKRKWKEYWFYLLLGYFIWTILIIAFSKYFLFTKK